MDDQQFARLLDYFKASWKGYRKVRKGVKKRVARHMEELGCRTMDAYLAELSADSQIRAECERRMTVSVSRFFRDLRLWSVLETRVLPELIHRHPGRLAVWFAGCACGEEVYTFKIMWQSVKERFPGIEEPYVLATDLNPQYFEKAQNGVYGKGSLKEVSDETRARFFMPLNDHFAVCDELKTGITWQTHHLLADPLPKAAPFHLIFLRNNLLTYYLPDVQREGLRKILSALMPNGFLMIGNDERLPENRWGLSPCDRSIYRKMPDAQKA